MSTKPQAEIEYPDSDGRPIADNTLQFRWIATIVGNLQSLYQDDPEVFVAGDLLWYPVEGNNKLRTAPDALVAFGRPKGDRGSYIQWREGGVAPQVVFEVDSPSNRPAQMRRKLQFYEQYGVEEYYRVDPDNHTLRGWQRRGEALQEIAEMDGWVSPRLGIRFEASPGEVRLWHPDGSPFLTHVELLEAAQREARRAESERLRAEGERERAKAERERAERMAARLRDLGIDPLDGLGEDRS